MIKKYEVSVEVEGNFAMFADPQTGSESISYPAPPFSAAKGIFESILFLRRATVIPTKTHICRAIRFVDVGFNSCFTPLRKSNSIANDYPLQQREKILYRPIFQLFAEIESETQPINHAHSYQEQFNRRLKRGQSWRRPCLGRSDYPCTYVGELRPETQPCDEVNYHIPSFLHHSFDKNQFGTRGETARFVQNVLIQNGILNYQEVA